MELVRELSETQGVSVSHVAVWNWLRQLGLTHKKDLRAAEQMRPDVHDARCFWVAHRQPFMGRIGFIDEPEDREAKLR